MIEITKSEAESLMEFIETNIFDIIRNDEYIDNINWLTNIVSVYMKCKNPQKYKSGRWIDGESECPVCGEDKFKNLDADIWADWKPPFCPNCGASMEE